MDWATVKDILGVWGGALSSVLALWRLLEARPRFILETYDARMGDPWFRIRAKNEAKYPIHISRLSLLLPRMPSLLSSVSIDKWTTRDVVRSAVDEGRLDVVVPPGQEAKIEFLLADEAKWCVLGIFWYRHRSIIFPTFPTIIVRTKRQLKQLKAHPLP